MKAKQRDEAAAKKAEAKRMAAEEDAALSATKPAKAKASEQKVPVLGGCLTKLMHHDFKVTAVLLLATVADTKIPSNFLYKQVTSHQLQLEREARQRDRQKEQEQRRQDQKRNVSFQTTPLIPFIDSTPPYLISPPQFTNTLGKPACRACDYIWNADICSLSYIAHARGTASHCQSPSH